MGNASRTGICFLQEGRAQKPELSALLKALSREFAATPWYDGWSGENLIDDSEDSLEAENPVVAKIFECENRYITVERQFFLNVEQWLEERAAAATRPV